MYLDPVWTGYLVDHRFSGSGLPSARTQDPSPLLGPLQSLIHCHKYVIGLVSRCAEEQSRSARRGHDGGNYLMPPWQLRRVHVLLGLSKSPLPKGSLPLEFVTRSRVHKSEREPVTH